MARHIRLNIAGQVPGALFVIAVPLFLITASVTWAINDLRLYRYGFDEYHVSRVTGIDEEGLMAAARQIRGYFNSTREPLEIRATIFGEEKRLFSQREVLHMRDVKRLIWGVYGVAASAGVYIMGFAAVGFAIHGRGFIQTIARRLLWGSGLTLALVVVVGLASLVGFDSLFRAFHQLSFANDFWQLDPQQDYLIMMFPQGFWFDATLFVGIAAAAEAVFLGAIAVGLLALRRRHRRKQERVLQYPSTSP